MRALRRSVPVLLATGSIAAAALTSGPSIVQAGPVLGPSGKPAVSMTFAAGHNPVGEHEDPVPALPDAGIADVDTVKNQLAYAKQAAALPVSQPGRAWKNVGPFGQDDPSTYPSGGLRFARGAGMGATAAVDTRDPSGRTIYIGEIGGLWRSTDAGATWKVLGDGVFARSGVGAVALDPNHPGDLYAGTGVALATLSGDTPGAGVYVSHDSGAHWTRPAKNVKGYGVNVILPTPSGVLVGTSNGLYLTRDRGASFTAVPLPDNATHTGPATGAYANWITAAVANPRKPLEITVAVGLPYGKRKGPNGQPLSPGNGLYRSKTGAAGTFSYLPSSAGLTNPGASVDPLGRIVLAYGTSTTEETPVLWAIVQDAGLLNGQQPAGADIVSTTTGRSANATNTLLNGLYRSDDDGLTWNVKGTPASIAPSPNEGLGVYPALGYGVGVQAFYNLWLAVDPRDSSQVYFGLEEVFQSIGGTQAGPGLGAFDVIQKYWDVCGATTYLENIYTGTTCPDGTPFYGGPATHPDQHVGVITKLPGGKIRLYTGNDGGFFRQDSSAQSTGGQFDQDHWTDMNHLASVQPYRVARTPDGHYVTALQDNGGGVFSPGGTNKLISSGDGVWAIATSDSKTFYTSAQGAILYVTRDGGKTIREIQPDLTSPNFTSPIAIDPMDENHLVAAAQDVEETVKGPDTTTLIDPLLYTVVKTDWTQSFDAGTSTNINPATKAAIKWTSQALAVRGAAIYDAICGLCRNSLGDPTAIHTTVATNVGKPGCTPKVANGDCWHIAAGKGLPHVAIQGMVIDPANTKTVYVALNENANIGLDQKVVGSPRIMVSHDAGEHFSDITGKLPHSNARDLVIRDGQLIAATDNGVFTTSMKGAPSWRRLGTGLPAVRVYDLSLDRTGQHLSIAVYGRGVWDLDFGRKATTSSSGPGLHGGPKATGGGSAGGGKLAATGFGSALPVTALLLLVLGAALGVRRFRRTAS
ncbi:MAG: hypothetical protein ABR549_01645 [Mycobacteriales bacterium]